MVLCSSPVVARQQEDQQQEQKQQQQVCTVAQFKSRHEQLKSFIRFERNKIKEFQARYQSQLIGK